MIDRRRFLKSLGAGAGVLIALPALPALARPKKVAIHLDKFDTLKPVGGSVVVRVKDTELLLVHDAEGSIRAFDPTCTHLKCAVAYRPVDRRLVCPCHASTYDLDGVVLGGPAPRALRRYDAVLKDDTIVLTLDDAGS